MKLDTCGEKCPVPILKAKKALAKMDSGQQLTVLATDPSAVSDFEFFGKQTGNHILHTNENNGVYTIVIQRK